jgi:hypothetical protein
MFCNCLDCRLNIILFSSDDDEVNEDNEVPSIPIDDNDCYLCCQVTRNFFKHSVYFILSEKQNVGAPDIR